MIFVNRKSKRTVESETTPMARSAVAARFRYGRK
jgi:hypothetical protein